MNRRLSWFCFHHEWMTSPSLALIARRVKQPRHLVMATWIAVNTYASQQNPRGTLDGICIEDIAYSLEADEAIIQCIITEFYKKGLLTKNGIADWEDWQVKRIDDSKERVKAFRERQKSEGQLPDSGNESDDVTPRNAVKRNVTRIVHNITVHNKTGENIYTNSKKSSESNINLNSTTPGESTRARKRGASRTCLPLDFENGIIPEPVLQWAQAKGFDRLEDHLEHFICYAKASGKLYADWNAALMNAIRKNWADLPANNSVNRHAKPYYDKFGRFDSTRYLSDEFEKALAAENLDSGPVCSPGGDLLEPLPQHLSDRRRH